MIAEQTVVKKEKKTEFLDFEMLDCEEVKVTPEMDDVSVQRVEGDEEINTILHLKTEFAEVYRKFSQVCTELKLLYVAITRPKKLLLIYDEDTSLRVPL